MRSEIAIYLCVDLLLLSNQVEVERIRLLLFFMTSCILYLVLFFPIDLLFVDREREKTNKYLPPLLSSQLRR